MRILHPLLVLVAGPISDLDPAGPKIKKEAVLKLYACQPYVPPRSLLACALAVIAQIISRLCRVNRFYSNPTWSRTGRRSDLATR